MCADGYGFYGSFDRLVMPPYGNMCNESKKGGKSVETTPGYS